MNYIDYLVNSIHSTIIATIDSNNHPVTRVIDMMHYDEDGIYFLTAKGKEFYQQLMDQKYISLSATKDKVSISLNGKVKNIGKEKLNDIFEKKYIYAKYLSRRQKRTLRSLSNLSSNRSIF